jgi:hypothetical protein
MKAEEYEMRPIQESPVNIHNLASLLKPVHPADLNRIADLLCRFIEGERSSEAELCKEDHVRKYLTAASEKAAAHRALMAEATPREFNVILVSFAELVGKTHAYIHMLQNSGHADEVLRAQGFYESVHEVENEIIRIADGIGSEIWLDAVAWSGYIDSRSLRPIEKYLGETETENVLALHQLLRKQYLSDEKPAPFVIHAESASSSAVPQPKTAPRRQYWPDIAIAIAAAVIAVILFSNVNAWHSAPASTANRAWHFFAWGICYLLLLAAPISIWVRHLTRGEVFHCSPAENSVR